VVLRRRQLRWPLYSGHRNPCTPDLCTWITGLKRSPEKFLSSGPGPMIMGPRCAAEGRGGKGPGDTQHRHMHDATCTQPHTYTHIHAWHVCILVYFFLGLLPKPSPLRTRVPSTMLPATCPSSANQLTHPPPFLYYYKCLMGCKPKREFWYSFYHSLCLAGESDTNRKSSLTNRNMIYHTVFTTPGAFGCVRQKPKLIHHKPKHASSYSFYNPYGCVYCSETNRHKCTAIRNI